MPEASDMLRIRRSAIWCYVDAEPKLFEWAHKAMTIHTQRYGMGGFQPYEMPLLSAKTKRFPAGLLSYFCEQARKASKEFLLDAEVPLPFTIHALPDALSHLYDYQVAAIDACLVQKRGVVKCPTGSGKTEIAVGLVSRITCPVLFLADEKTLIQQTIKRYETITGEAAGMLGEGELRIGRFTVGSFQTVRRYLQREEFKAYLKTVGCLIVDEVHVVGARTYYKTAMSIPAPMRIGLSATPTGRSDKRDAYVIGATGPVIYTLPIQELVDRGRLAKSLVLFYEYPGAQFRDGFNPPFHKLYKTCICQEEARNRAVARICKLTPKPVLVFFERVGHGYLLQSLLEVEGFNVKIVHGDMTGPERMQLAADLGSGKLHVLLCSKVFNKGIDIPQIRSAVNVAGYKAAITAMQRLGRPMRVAEGKDKFVFWDLIDKHHPILMRHTRQRAKTYLAAGVAVHRVEHLEEAMEKIRSFYKDPEPTVIDQERPSIAITPWMRSWKMS